jgi:ABC-type branched-subunit amino acid transport system ATPase component
MTAVALREITQKFGGLSAVDDVSLSIERGTIHGIIGPNGAGKTTLLNIISGLQKPTHGTIHVGDHDVTRWKAHRYVTKAGLVRTFQTVRLFSSMTVRENVMVAARARRSATPADERVDAVLRRLDLTSLQGDLAVSLPYGLQRRVEIARVLVAEPEVVLLDEPAAGLSPNERSDLANLLTQMRDEGMTIVLVEHHMDLVHAVCQHCTVLDFGAVISEGTPEEVTADPAVLTAYFGGADNAFRRRIKEELDEVTESPL